MWAMPVATMGRGVFARSQEECTSAFRPRLSGIHSAAYPHSSTRFANAAAAVAVIPSIEIQTPSFPSSIAASPADHGASVNPRAGSVQPCGCARAGTHRERERNPRLENYGSPPAFLAAPAPPTIRFGARPLPTCLQFLG